MDQDFLDKSQRFDEMMKGRIVSRIENRSEVLKSEEQEAFEDRVNKGEVEVIMMDDIDENTRIVKGENYKKIQDECDKLISKGQKEDEYLTQEEFDWLEDQQSKMKNFVEKAIPVPDGHGGTVYEQIFVEEQEK